MLARMSEMMFVDAVRRYAEHMPADSAGWLAGLRDRFVGRALALLHEHPARDWSIDELGREIGLSRSALHERFVALIGVAPMQYLAQWRMQAAARLLLETPRDRGGDRARRRLRVRGGVRARLQASGRNAAGGLAARAARRRGERPKRSVGACVDNHAVSNIARAGRDSGST